MRLLPLARSIMTYSRELLFAAATAIHDEKVSDKHCDRKYLDVCGIFINGILEAPAYLAEIEKERARAAS